MAKKNKQSDVNYHDVDAPNFEYDHLGGYHHDRMAADFPEHHTEGYLSCPTCVAERTAKAMNATEPKKRSLSLTQFSRFLKR